MVVGDESLGMSRWIRLSQENEVIDIVYNRRVEIAYLGC